MIYPVNLPDIGEGVVEGEIIEWLKSEGESVAKDEPVVVVMTDKATVELPSPVAGILKKKHGAAGDTAHLGKPLYEMEVEEMPQTALQKKEEKAVKPAAEAKELKEGPGEGLATPKTRKLAEKLGVDLSAMKGSAAGGRITDEDVVRFHAGSIFQKPRAPLRFENDVKEPALGVRKTMAARMQEAKATIPHFSFFDRCDATALGKMKAKIGVKAQEGGMRLTYMPLLIRALAKTAEKFPEANASFDPVGPEYVLHKEINVGIATKREDGLIIAVLKGVQKLSLEELIRGYDALIKKAREGTLSRNEMTGSTITISNFGPLGGRFATPIINPPESTILGVAKIQEEAVAKRGEVVVQPTLNLSWSFDHRIIDGAKAAEISAQFISLITNPAQML